MHAAAKVLAHTFVVHCGFACRRRLSGNNFMTAIIDQNQAAAPSGFWVLLTSSLVSSLIMLDSNIVAVSLPAMGRSLGASFTDIQWVISAYVLTYASLLLASGNYADLYGRKKSMIIGLLIFAVASVGCGLATTSTLLNVARGLQGIGGAFLLTASLAIIGNAFKGAERTRAFAFWGASLGIALAIGPIVGGIITSTIGWRWVFLVNIPACAILIAATFKFIEESRDSSATNLDFGGIVTFSGGLALLVWGLIDGNDAGWSSPTILIRLAAAAILFAVFVVVELRTPQPMVDFNLFKKDTFLGAVLAMIGYGASAQVMIFFLPLYLQNAYDFEPLIAGVAMIPFAIPMVAAPRMTARLASLYSGRALLTTGLAIAMVGDILFAIFAYLHLPYYIFVLSMLVAGCGAGLLNGQTVKVISGAVPENRAGMASGLASTTRFIGILVSVAVLGAILSDVANRHFVIAATGLGLDKAAAEVSAKKVISGDLEGMVASAPESLRVALRTTGLTAYSSGFSEASILAAVIALLACALTFHYVRFEDTAPVRRARGAPIPCKTLDCKDPL
jgi:EmrB/QacA subfamily drug resistance transporter